MQKFLYDTVAHRDRAMVHGMQQTLDGIRDALER
jgi:hypothetical protein